MTILLIIGLFSLVLMLVVAAVLMPSKSASSHDSPSREHSVLASPSPAYSAPPSPSRDPDEDRWRMAMAQWDAANRQSLRDRQLDEDAAAIAGEYRRISNERYLDSLRSDAAAYFSAPTTAKKSAT